MWEKEISAASRCDVVLLLLFERGFAVARFSACTCLLRVVRCAFALVCVLVSLRVSFVARVLRFVCGKTIILLSLSRCVLCVARAFRLCCFFLALDITEFFYLTA